MTKEEKELLLKDFSSRLPYGVKVNNEIQGDFNIYGICENFVFGRTEVSHVDFDVEKIKPYLFPLSSMTEEQLVVYGDLCYAVIHSLAWDMQAALDELFDWLNKNHFDYRGLIEKGLAIEAPEGMYN